MVKLHNNYNDICPFDLSQHHQRRPSFSAWNVEYSWTLMLHPSRSPDAIWFTIWNETHPQQTNHSSSHEENDWTNITGRHVKTRASLSLFFLFVIISKSICRCQTHEHRTNIIQLQNSLESSLRDKFEINSIAFTHMSSASERWHFIIYCSCSFSFPRACRKKVKYAGSQ